MIDLVSVGAHSDASTGGVVDTIWKIDGTELGRSTGPPEQSSQNRPRNSF